MRKQQRADIIKSLFLSHYTNAKSELNYSNIYELLIAVMLSAQCTDKRVNIVTPALFARYPSTKELSNADIDELKELIKSVSFFNMKAKNLISMARSVERDFSGNIPCNQDDLKKLDGIGQKSANVVLSEFFGLNYIAVDTHVFRVSHRLGLSKSSTALQTESDLTTLFKDNLHILHQAFVLFGRYTCKAINPICSNCFVAKYCVSKGSFKPR